MTKLYVTKQSLNFVKRKNMKYAPSINHVNKTNCIVCGTEILNCNKNKIYCSDKCRQQGKRANDCKDFEKYVIAKPQTEININNISNIKNGLDAIQKHFLDLQNFEYHLYQIEKYKKWYDLVDANTLNDTERTEIASYEKDIKAIDNVIFQQKTTITELFEVFTNEINETLAIMKNSLKS